MNGAPLVGGHRCGVPRMLQLLRAGLGHLELCDVPPTTDGARPAAASLSMLAGPHTRVLRQALRLATAPPLVTSIAREFSLIPACA